MNAKITELHFGGNSVFSHNTENGKIKEEFSEAINRLGISSLRYPGGQTEMAFQDGLLKGGGLPKNLVDFLQSARNEDLKVTIVVPTNMPEIQDREIEIFSNILAKDFGDVVFAIEIGNEFWSKQTEEEYSQAVNKFVKSISKGAAQHNKDFEILVQMANPSGSFSEFKRGRFDGNWEQRSEYANLKIISGLDGGTIDQIDGVVEHYYLKSAGVQIDFESDGNETILADHRIWEFHLKKELSLNLTEWNIRTDNLDQLGMRSAGAMLAQFQHMIKIGVDTAFVWPPQHNTATDLAGSKDVIVDDASGIVVNSVGGAIFDLMASSLPGSEILEISQNQFPKNVSHFSFFSEDTITSYIVSHSDVEISFELDVKNIFGSGKISSATKVGFDPSSSNGWHFSKADGWVEADFFELKDGKYYYNEHDVRATIELIDIAGSVFTGSQKFSMKPFEVVEIKMPLFSGSQILGTNGQDLLYGTESNDIIFGFSGEDEIHSGAGNDLIYLGGRSNFVYSGPGDDEIHGGFGKDFIYGYEGSDQIFGGEGDDEIYAGSGENVIFGNEGDDFIVSEGRNDFVDGGEGNDTILAYGAFSKFRGGAGNDTFVIDKAGIGSEILDFEFLEGDRILVDEGAGFFLTAISPIQFGAGFNISFVDSRGEDIGSIVVVPDLNFDSVAPSSLLIYESILFI